jgi:hypothetical protein
MSQNMSVGDKNAALCPPKFVQVVWNARDVGDSPTLGELKN